MGDDLVTPPSSGRMWGAMAPTVAFLGANSIAGVVVGAVAATVVAVVVIGWRARHHERIGWILPISLAYVVARGTISALTGSEDVYFGIGLAVSAAFACVVITSAFTQRPLAVYMIPLAVRYPAEVRRHRTYRSVAAHISVVWALADLSVTGWETWHLTSVGPAEFVGKRALIGWPVMAFVVFWLIFYVRLRLDPVAHALRAGPPSAGDEHESGPSVL